MALAAVVFALSVQQLGTTLYRVTKPEDPATDSAPYSAHDPLTERTRKLLAAQPALARAEHTLVVKKSQFTLEARIGSEVVKRYVVNLGADPFRKKERQGDGRTPEGHYYVRDIHDSRFLRFFGLSYPSAADADRGFSAGLIDRATADSLKSADRRGGLPNWRTALGGAIGIHGGGAYLDEGATVLIQNWTLGCVALRNVDLLELGAFSQNGISVEILP